MGAKSPAVVRYEGDAPLVITQATAGKVHQNENSLILFIELLQHTQWPPRFLLDAGSYLWPRHVALYLVIASLSPSESNMGNYSGLEEAYGKDRPSRKMGATPSPRTRDQDETVKLSML